MRLTHFEQETIRDVVKKLDPNARIFLFGSRADDAGKGGDIDLLILTKDIRRDQRIDIKVDLKKKIGDQRIDIIIDQDLSRPFTRLAFETAVPL